MFTRSPPRSLRSSAIHCRPRRNRLSLALFLGLVAAPAARAAVPLVGTRIGAGPSRIQSSTREINTWGSFGSLRLAAYQERLHLIAGLDLNAWRLSHVTDEVKPKDMDGDDVLIFLGLSEGPWTTWLGFGGGQIRVYDRQTPDEADPHRYLSQTSAFGGSYDIYRAEYGKIDISLTWRHVQPEKDWRSRYALTMIDALQIEFGFKLLGW